MLLVSFSCLFHIYFWTVLHRFLRDSLFENYIELSTHSILSYYRKERRFKALSVSTLLNVILDVCC